MRETSGNTILDREDGGSGTASRDKARPRPSCRRLLSLYQSLLSILAPRSKKCGYLRNNAAEIDERSQLASLRKDSLRSSELSEVRPMPMLELERAQR